MCNIRAKVLSDDDVPGGPVASVELLLDLGGDVFLDVVLLKGGGGDVDGFLLHLLAHVDVLDDGFGAGAVCLRDRAGIRAGGGVDFVCHGVLRV